MSDSQTANQPGASKSIGAWTLSVSTDEFGDATSDSYTSITSDFTGTFSNTATTGSDLTGTVTIFWSLDDKYGDGGSYLVAFDMVEYGNTPFTYLDSDITLGNKLKTKSSSGEKNEYGVGGFAPDGALVVYGGGLGGRDGILSSLINEPGEMRCILNFGNTTFDFNIDCNGFAEAFSEFDAGITEVMDYMKAKADAEEAAKAAEAAAEIDAVSSHSVDEAIEKIKGFTQEELQFPYAVLYLDERVSQYSPLSQSDLESLFPGNYYMIDVRNAKGMLGFISGDVSAFGDDGVVRYLNDVSEDGSRTEVYNPDLTRSYTVEDDRLVIMSDETWSTSWTKNYEVRKVAEDFYIVLEEGELQLVMWPAD